MRGRGAVRCSGACRPLGVGPLAAAASADAIALTTVDPAFAELRSAGGARSPSTSRRRRRRLGRARGRSRQPGAADGGAQRFRRAAAAGARARSGRGRRPPARARVPARQLDAAVAADRRRRRGAAGAHADVAAAPRRRRPSRREPVVGIGDAVRTVTPRRAPAPAPALALAGPNGAGPSEAPADAPAASEAPPPVPAAELAALAVPARATGPLDAEQGARSFDNERPGKAADDDTLRAASNEPHPGLTDFSRPAAPSPTAASDGRGPGAQAGAVARPASGAAPSQLGAPNRDAAAAEASERAPRAPLSALRAGNPAARQPRARISQAARAPLEQGVTIVYFVVGADGQVVRRPAGGEVVGIRRVRQRRAARGAARRAVSADAVRVADVDVRHIRQSSDPMTVPGLEFLTRQRYIRRRWPGREMLEPSRNKQRFRTSIRILRPRRARLGRRARR